MFIYLCTIYLHIYIQICVYMCVCVFIYLFICLCTYGRAAKRHTCTHTHTTFHAKIRQFVSQSPVVLAAPQIALKLLGKPSEIHSVEPNYNAIIGIKWEYNGISLEYNANLMGIEWNLIQLFMGKQWNLTGQLYSWEYNWNVAGKIMRIV